MTIQAYDELAGIARRTPRAMPEVIVSFGRHGRQIAATRVGRGGTIQARIWRKASRRWTKWRKLQVAEILGLAQQADRDAFRPDYGTPWERD
jgi:hypothetical protein